MVSPLLRPRSPVFLKSLKILNPSQQRPSAALATTGKPPLHDIPGQQRCTINSELKLFALEREPDLETKTALLQPQLTIPRACNAAEEGERASVEKAKPGCAKAAEEKQKDTGVSVKAEIQQDLLRAKIPSSNYFIRVDAQTMQFKGRGNRS